MSVLWHGLPTLPPGRPEVSETSLGPETFGQVDGGVWRPAPSALPVGEAHPTQAFPRGIRHAITLAQAHDRAAHGGRGIRGRLAAWERNGNNFPKSRAAVSAVARSPDRRSPRLAWGLNLRSARRRGSGDPRRAPDSRRARTAITRGRARKHRPHPAQRAFALPESRLVARSPDLPTGPTEGLRAWIGARRSVGLTAGSGGPRGATSPDSRAERASAGFIRPAGASPSRNGRLEAQATRPSRPNGAGTDGSSPIGRNDLT